MRISTSQLHQQGLGAMQRQQVRLARAQEDLASGLRVRQAADDPLAWQSASTLDSERSAIAGFQLNADRLTSRLEREEGALTQFGDLLHRVRELAVQANSAGQGAESRQLIATELRALREQVLAVANSGDGEGHGLFAGASGTATPFALSGSGASYSGDTQARLLPISEGLSLSDGDDGAAVFLNAPGGDVFASLQNLMDVVEQNPVGDAAKAQWQTDYAAALGTLSTMQDHVADLRGSVGTRLKAVEEAQAALAARDEQVQTLRSELVDVDYAEATTRLALTQTALQAAQQSYIRVQQLSLFEYLR